MFPRHRNIYSNLNRISAGGEPRATRPALCCFSKQISDGLNQYSARAGRRQRRKTRDSRRPSLVSHSQQTTAEASITPPSAPRGTPSLLALLVRSSSLTSWPPPLVLYLRPFLSLLPSPLLLSLCLRPFLSLCLRPFLSPSTFACSLPSAFALCSPSTFVSSSRPLPWPVPLPLPYFLTLVLPFHPRPLLVYAFKSPFPSPYLHPSSPSPSHRHPCVFSTLASSSCRLPSAVPVPSLSTSLSFPFSILPFFTLRPIIPSRPLPFLTLRVILFLSTHCIFFPFFSLPPMP